MNDIRNGKSSQKTNYFKQQDAILPLHLTLFLISYCLAYKYQITDKELTHNFQKTF